MKDKIVLFCWITGILFFIALFWSLTQSVQTRYLSRTVNNVFINNNESRRVQAFIPNKKSKTNQLGYWYSLINSQDELFVFTVFQDGILIPLGAVVKVTGEVEEIIPLSGHARKIFDKIPQSTLKMYTRRIEEGTK